MKYRAQMRPKTPNKIHPRMLLLRPKGSPVPSVLILSSTSAIAGPDTVAAQMAAIREAFMPVPVVPKGESFLSMLQLTLPFVDIAGSPAYI